jgi:hypothetical protein
MIIEYWNGVEGRARWLFIYHPFIHHFTGWASNMVVKWTINN